MHCFHSFVKLPQAAAHCMPQWKEQFIHWTITSSTAKKAGFFFSFIKPETGNELTKYHRLITLQKHSIRRPWKTICNLTSSFMYSSLTKMLSTVDRDFFLKYFEVIFCGNWTCLWGLPLIVSKSHTRVTKVHSTSAIWCVSFLCFNPCQLCSTFGLLQCFKTA